MKITSSEKQERAANARAWKRMADKHFRGNLAALGRKAGLDEKRLKPLQVYIREQGRLLPTEITKINAVVHQLSAPLAPIKITAADLRTRIERCREELRSLIAEHTGESRSAVIISHTVVSRARAPFASPE